MRVLILGGTGFIGRALTRELDAAGHEPVVLTRGPDRPRQGGAHGSPEHVHWDGERGDGFAKHLAGAALVNLAGENIAARRWTAARKKSLLHSRLSAGRAACEAARKARPTVLVQASAVGVYGPRGDELVDEETTSIAARPSFLEHVARQWEASTAEVESLGVRRVILRTGVVLGRGGMLEKLLPPFRWYVGGPPGSGLQWLSWIHIQDAVGAIRFLIEHDDAAGPFNLTAPGAATMAGFCQTLGHVLSRPSWLSPPASALRLLLGELADELILSGQRVAPKRLLQLGYTFRFPELPSALRDLLGRQTA